MRVEFGTTELQAANVFQNVQIGTHQRLLQITCEDPDPDDARYISLVEGNSEVSVVPDGGVRRTYRYSPDESQYSIRFGAGTPQVVIILTLVDR